MTKLYSDFANLYHAMYQTFINYDEEYIFYKSLLEKYRCNSIIEMGCGSGHPAKRFIEDNFDYTGSDISAEMLAIAKKIAPTPGCCRQICAALYQLQFLMRLQLRGEQ